MTFREKLRRGRSHILLVVVMILVSILVVNLKDDTVQPQTGQARPHHPVIPDTQRPG